MFFPVSGRLREFRAVGVRLYVEGLRRVAGMLCELGFQVSLESVRGWFHISSGGPMYGLIAECIRFLEVVRVRYASNPAVYRDRVPWYGWPMKVLGLRRVETFGRRNTIESWFSGLKRRIKQFNTCSPTYRPKVPEKWIKAWVSLS
ncbi:MAG: hypothetical protein QXU87_01255 [Candidatus Caldarchaeum sp.]